MKIPGSLNCLCLLCSQMRVNQNILQQYPSAGDLSHTSYSHNVIVSLVPSFVKINLAQCEPSAQWRGEDGQWALSTPFI